MKLYFIACRFQLVEGDPKIDGFAVCSSPDDVVTFLMPDGQPVTMKSIWDYDLKHFNPWVALEN